MRYTAESRAEATALHFWRLRETAWNQVLEMGGALVGDIVYMKVDVELAKRGASG